MPDLRTRIDAAIARVKASRAADEVLAEIASTHVLIDRDEAMNLYNVLMSVDKRTAARTLLELMEGQRP